MSFFDFFKPKNEVTSLRTDCIVLKDIDPEFYVYVAVAIDNGKLVYFNKHIPSHHFKYNQRYNETDFIGRLFKIEMTLRGNHRFDVFYAIPTDDPQGLLMSMNPTAYDNFGVAVLQALIAQYPDIVNLRELTDAPTRWAYHLSYRNDGIDWLINNNFGSDCYYIHGNQVRHGTGPEMAKIYSNA